MGYLNIISETADGIGLITINRPEVLNALDLATLREIECEMGRMCADRGVRAVIITGAGDKAFVSGADIAAMRAMSPEEAREFALAGHSCMLSIEGCPKPLIAAVNGFALGGGTELAIACDVVIAAEAARFGLPEVKLGLYPGFGGTQRLPRLIGPSRAKELIFSGRVISAKEALEWGIVSRIVPLPGLIEAARGLAKEMASNSPHAIAAAKRLIVGCAETGLKDGLAAEREGFSRLFTHPDRIEGLSAFLEKRKANFGER